MRHYQVPPPLSQSGPGYNYYEYVIHISQITRTGASLSDGVLFHTREVLRSVQQIQSEYSKARPEKLKISQVVNDKGVSINLSTL